MKINQKQFELIESISGDLNNHAKNWIGEVFTRDHAKTLLELSGFLDQILNAYIKQNYTRVK